MIDPQRIQYLEGRVHEQTDRPERRTHTISFRGESIHPVVIRVDMDFPRYRLTNGRTRRKQEEYLANHNEVPRDLFRDPASEQAQAAQHEILVEMAELAHLEELLENEGQREPLVATYDGYVVNGNRRLAILRKLGAVPWVDLAVLPSDAGQRDLAMLEMNLQMAEDGKAAYNWVDELLTIQTNIEELGIEKRQVAAAMHAYEKTINLKLHQLALVNLYLEELGHAGEHYLVEGDEQAFETLAKADMKLRDAAKQANLRQLAFNIIKYPRPGSSVHRQIEALVRSLDYSVTLLVGTLATRDTSGDSGSGTTDNGAWDSDVGTLLAELDDEPVTDVSPPPVIFAAPVSRENAEAINEAVGVASSLTNEDQEAQRPLRIVKDAAALLQSVRIKTDTTDAEVLLAQLSTIEARCTHIRDEVRRIKGVE